MADDLNKPEKSPHALREERILAEWKEKGIFDKTLAKDSPKGEFVFYEGPPTANGRPGIHHLEARSFKDAIPRYRTMRGYHVRRKGGWDTHGLPVELQVEKELGLKSKKEIETYGIAAFNDKCKESVWKYVHEWEQFTDRIGYWIDLKNPYITYKPNYIESLWNIVKKVDHDKLLYKDYKVLPWCPRCGTALSSHELAQGYEDVKDLSVYVKFKVIKNAAKREKGNEYLLAWTTTPWTLPGNVALAVGPKITYVKVRVGDDSLVLAKERLALIKEPYEIEGEVSGEGLVAKGLEYEPLYPFLAHNLSAAEKEKLPNAYKIYTADFVTTTDGTGIVHTAVMYGQDDFELGTKVGLPKHHLVKEDGTFKDEAGFLGGMFVKDANTDVAIIKDLAGRGLLFAKEKYQHSYPHCWRCHTPLIYFARDSWYIRMSELRDKLVKENRDIHWEPEHVKDGRFGEWLKDLKDWAISRERYWGTPLPVWNCAQCQARKIAGSISDVSRAPKNTYYIMRHGEAENNERHVLSTKADVPHRLTKKGEKEVLLRVETIQKIKPDVVFVSPFVRTRQTADILKKALGWNDGQVIVDDRIRELGGGEFNGRDISEYYEKLPLSVRFEQGPEGGETYVDIKKRVGDFLYDIESRYQGKTILIVSHETPLCLLTAAASGLDRAQSLALRDDVDFIANADCEKLNFAILPHNAEYELDLHRPFIDEVKLVCHCGGEMSRVKEVMDVWFDSGAMPFAQNHYPFENKELIDGGLLKKASGYPADFISEAVDQTRGWFYTLHAVGALMGKGKAYKNVISLGHILDAEGKKMSKSLGNTVDPWKMIDLYGADVLRFWMYSVNQPGDSKNFDEKTVDEVMKKVFNLALNVLSFYEMYAEQATGEKVVSKHVLDQWIMARLHQLTATVTDGLDEYRFLEPTRAIRDFTADLSQWYIRRSRDRFKGDDEADKQAALATTKAVLLGFAKILAPFTPFLAEDIYKRVGGELESVHLEEWPTAKKTDIDVLSAMVTVRDLSSKGLEARMRAKINVRQPLQTLKASKSVTLAPEYVEIVKDEVNVKEVTFTSASDTVELDTVITPSLKEEGDLRELLRKIQDMRKEKGLSVGDKAVLVATDDLKTLIANHETHIKKSTNLSKIEFGDVLGLRAL